MHEAALKGTALVPAGGAITIAASVPHGHVAAVHAMALKLVLPALLGPACRERDLALALVISRVAVPASKLSTLAQRRLAATVVHGPRCHFTPRPRRARPACG